MPEINMPYGTDNFVLNLDQNQIMTIVNSNPLDLPKTGSEEAVRTALANPIATAPLASHVKKGDRICLIVPDVTRLWQSPHITAPLVVAELNRAGVRDEDITILCACGTHMKMSREDHIRLVGADLVNRLKIVDHQCEEMAEMRRLGATSRGTDVYVNRHAVEADKVITLCGVAYHFLAGFGGGAKMVVPGIAASETIQHNHKLALNPGFGSGINPNVRCGNISDDNPFYADLMEAAAMLPVCFSMDVVADDQFNIVKAFAGDWRQAHLEACKLLEKMEGVHIPARSDFVIASAGGSPKDLNLYQSIKTLNNAMAAAKPGATLVILTKCPQGIGNPDCEMQICDLDNMEAREKSLRAKFSIGSFVGYLCAQTAEDFNFVLVTDIPAEKLAKTKIHAARTLAEGMEIARKLAGFPKDVVVMPHGASTYPIPE